MADIRKILRTEPDYPDLLRAAEGPLTLYIKGDLTDRPRMAVVGTRKCTMTGASAARAFGRALAEAGVCVVSGLAFGIDAAAHEGALAGGGPTWAVLGNGLDRIYPRSHTGLAEKILRGGGALLAEYPPGTPARDFQFLERNRIISGLCRAVLIIEAPLRSGALVTARFAAEQGRDVFVLPGPAGHPNFEGAHRLIRDGATLVESPAMLLEDMGIAPVPAPAAAADASPATAVILAALTAAGRPLTIDEISEKTKLSPPDINRELTLLLVQDRLREDAGRYSI